MIENYRKINPNEVNKKNCTISSPLQSATLCKPLDNIRLVQILINFEANLNIENSIGITPLHHSVCF